MPFGCALAVVMDPLSRWLLLVTWATIRTAVRREKEAL